MHESGCNFLGPFKRRRPKDYSNLRSLVIDLVMGTDMKHHFKHVHSLRQLISQRGGSPQPQTDKTASSATATAAGGGTGIDSGSGSGSGTKIRVVEVRRRDNNAEFTLILKEVLHAADISNPAKPWQVCRFWTDCVMQEFYGQVCMDVR